MAAALAGREPHAQLSSVPYVLLAIIRVDQIVFCQAHDDLHLLMELQVSDRFVNPGEIENASVATWA
jgi:hypothetical protein